MKERQVVSACPPIEKADDMNSQRDKQIKANDLLGFG